MHNKVYIQISARLESYFLGYTIIKFINKESNLDSFIVIAYLLIGLSLGYEISSGGRCLHSKYIKFFSSSCVSDVIFRLYDHKVRKRRI